MITSVLFKLDYDGVGEMLKDSMLYAALMPVAERTLARAQAGAPVVSGDYRAGLHIEKHTTDRVVARVVGGTDHDLNVEADTGNLARSLGR
jgi:hypothetical protein